MNGANSWIIFMMRHLIVLMLVGNCAIYSCDKGLNNAGILPFAIKDRKVLFCLGCEWIVNPRTKQKEERWSDFGGKPKRRESVKQTALREVCEEVLDIFGTAFDRVSCISYMQDRMEPHGFSDPRMDSPYCMFLAEVDYIDPKKFHMRKQSVKWSEKTDVRWVDAREFMQEVCNSVKYKDNHTTYFGDRLLRGAFVRLLRHHKNKINELIASVWRRAQHQQPLEQSTPQATRVISVPVEKRESGSSVWQYLQTRFDEFIRWIRANTVRTRVAQSVRNKMYSQ